MSKDNNEPPPMNNDPKYFASNDYDHPDYKYGLREKGLYLDPAVRRVDLNTVPMNGTEFILRSKMEEEAMRRSNNGEHEDVNDGEADDSSDDEYEGVIEDLFELLKDFGFSFEPAEE